MGESCVVICFHLQRLPEDEPTPLVEACVLRLSLVVTQMVQLLIGRGLANYRFLLVNLHTVQILISQRIGIAPPVVNYLNTAFMGTSFPYVTEGERPTALGRA